MWISKYSVWLTGQQDGVPRCDMEGMGLTQTFSGDDNEVGFGIVIIDDEAVASVCRRAIGIRHLPEIDDWVACYDKDGFQVG